MKITRKQQGFTIIEVMIVLAIAGLIMVVALIAIPQLQRNQRNNARQSVMSRISTEIGNYAGNNNGRMPEQADIEDFYARYLGGLDIQDPRTGQNMPIVWWTGFTDGAVPSLSTDEVQVTVNSIDHDSDPATPNIDVTEKTGGGDLGAAFLQVDAQCDGESINTGTGQRTYALVTVLEGGGIYCLDNS